ncbi:hypothetical protein JCM10212_006335 [Sporobolomyces blumeae]
MVSDSLNQPTSSALTDLGITVFCGSSPGTDPVFLETADSLARAIARSGQTLVYGGGTKGLMGQVARSALENGGKVHGIIPTAFMAAEAPDRSSTLHPRETETLVPSMHARKRMMADLSRAFVGLPGGYGTLEEVMEMTTWSQLGIHQKPVILLNVNNFYSPLRDFIGGAIRSGFISPSNRNFLIFLDPPSSSSPTQTNSASPSSSKEESTTPFDWGQATLDRIEEWIKHPAGSGGATSFALDWGDAGGNRNQFA